LARYHRGRTADPASVANHNPSKERNTCRHHRNKLIRRNIRGKAYRFDDPVNPSGEIIRHEAGFAMPKTRLKTPAYAVCSNR